LLRSSQNFFDGIHQESKEMRMRGSGTDDGIDDEVEVEIEVQETKRGGKVRLKKGGALTATHCLLTKLTTFRLLLRRL